MHSIPTLTALNALVLLFSREHPYDPVFHIPDLTNYGHFILYQHQLLVHAYFVYLLYIHWLTFIAYTVYINVVPFYDTIRYIVIF